MLNNYISILWFVEDVQEVRPDLDDEQAYEVLLCVKANHDATLGINWDVLAITAEWAYPIRDRGNE